MSWEADHVHRLALEAGGIGVVVWDVEEGSLSWSPGGTSLGFPPGALPSSVPELMRTIHREDRDRLRELTGRIGQGEEVGPYDVRLQASEGVVRWVRARSRALDDGSGRPRWIVTAVVDASAEHRHRDRAARGADVDQLVAAAALRFVGVDRHGIERQLDAALGDVGQLLSARRVALVARVRHAPGWETRTRWLAPGEAADLRTDLPVELLDALDRGASTVRRTATGSWLGAVSGTDHDAHAIVARGDEAASWDDADAERLSLLAAACGQSVRQLALAADLERTTEAVDQLVASAPIILWRGTTDRFELDTVSANTQRAMGYPPEEFARRWYGLVHPDDADLVRDALRTGTRDGAASYTARLRHADGGYRSWHVTLEVEGPPGRRGRGVCGYSMDVTGAPAPRAGEHVAGGATGDGPTAIPAASADASRPGRATVLLVEDDPQIRDVVASVLRADGRQVLVAGDVAAAHAHGRGRRLDLLMTDLSLPDASGADLIAQLRADRPHLPVILMSGHASAWREVPDVVTLDKPFTLDQLRACVAGQLAAASRA